MTVAVAVDTVLLSLWPAPAEATADRPQLRVLLVRRRDEPFAGSLALPGRIIADDEDLDEAAVATLADLAGLGHPRHLEQLATFGRAGRDPRGRVISVTYLGLLPATGPPGPAARWVDPAAPSPALAFDHGRLLDAGVERLRSKLGYSNVAYGLLPDAFTLAELQSVYEAVLDRELDKRNFRRKVLGLDLLVETGQLRRGAHRPAAMYRFRRQKLETIDTAAIA